MRDNQERFGETRAIESRSRWTVQAIVFAVASQIALNMAADAATKGIECLVWVVVTWLS